MLFFKVACSEAGEPNHFEALLEFHFTTHCQIHQEGGDRASNFIDGAFKIINLRIVFFWGKELLKLCRWRLENTFPQDTFLPLPSPPKENKANKYGQAVTLGGQTSCLFSTFLLPSFPEYKKWNSTYRQVNQLLLSIPCCRGGKSMFNSSFSFALSMHLHWICWISPTKHESWSNSLLD